MNLLQPFKGAPRRVGRKRIAAAAASAPPGQVTVVAVTFVDPNYVYWKFSSPVVSWDNVNGLLINEQPPVDIAQITPEGWLLAAYNPEVAVGDPWEVSGDVALTFDGGGELELPESAVVSS